MSATIELVPELQFPERHRPMFQQPRTFQPRALTPVDPRYFEYRVYRELILHEWDVTDLRIEKLAEPRQLSVLRRIGAQMCGPDFLASSLDDCAAWAIDAKTSLRQLSEPGCNWFSISRDSLVSMESYAWQHGIPGCFVLGDMYVITPAEVRDDDPQGRRGERLGRDGKPYFLIHSGAGREFSAVFGHIGEYGLWQAAA